VDLDVLRAPVGALAARRSAVCRYLVVSAINVINHQALLALANTGWGWSGGRANVFAAALAAIPAYVLSRRWVWQARGPHSFRSEILPFWIIALVGLVVSSLLAEAADRIFGSGLPVALGSMSGYLVVWMLKFLVLEKLFERAGSRWEQVSVP
jgi:putative flippase GtrA